jgi:hypothetical protein
METEDERVDRALHRDMVSSSARVKALLRPNEQ